MFAGVGGGVGAGGAAGGGVGAAGVSEWRPNAERLRLLSALSASYPTIEAAIAEAAGLRAKLDLPMGLVHVLSDVHGEDAKLRHVINNASGALRPLIEQVLADRLNADERREFMALLYYPREALGRISPRIAAEGPAARSAWVYRTLSLQCEIIRALRKTYRRDLVDRLTPPEFRELFVELLSGQRPEFPRAMLVQLARFDRDWAALRAASHLIRSLASAEVLVAGDLGDRGPRMDKVVDILMKQPRVSLLWGNHDAIWMGASLGQLACMLTVLRFSARYRRTAQLAEGYGVLITPLEKLARDVYGHDPAGQFKPKGEGMRDPTSVARMQKAAAIMQFKAEGQLFAAHPEWGLSHRRLLHHIDVKAGTITLDGVTHPLLDTHLPTIDPANPYAYSPEEQACLSRLRDSFFGSQKLREHMQWVARRGEMWTRRDDVLIFHACVPVDEAGEPLSLTVDGTPRSGRELMDALVTVVRRAFRNRFMRDNPDADWLYYLWGGPRSPLFGKDRLSTFESAFLADKATHKEHKNPYFELLHDAGFVRKIGRMFGCGDDVLVVNGHVPVKVEKGDQPLKRGGNAVTIDGAFSEAYGDRGYTLVIRPDRIDLAEHAPFKGVEAVVDEGADIVPTVTTLRTYPRARTIGETDQGVRIRAEIGDLEDLVRAYQEGLLAERRG
ncbi:MAG: fructose-bisphosphatase class III [Phycisphaerales bacterium]|nr:fructose-bisphosphatase class III [Phycisphaerales bacterium]